jgi:hypothetical protein
LNAVWIILEAVPLADWGSHSSVPVGVTRVANPYFCVGQGCIFMEKMASLLPYWSQLRKKVPDVDKVVVEDTPGVVQQAEDLGVSD